MWRQNFGRKLKERDPLGGIGMDGRVNEGKLSVNLRSVSLNWGCWSVTCTGEHVNDPADTMKREEHLNWLHKKGLYIVQY